MDIFKQAKECDADYYDHATGYIYHIQEYNRCKRLGLPTSGILVTNYEGNIVGYVKEKNSDIK